MNKKMLYPFVTVLAVTGLAGCGKDVPSCGDVEATKLSSEILTELVTKDTGALADQIKQRIHFTIEQPVVVAHDEKLKSYSCKGVANYQVSDTTINALQRSQSDPAYQTELWKNWRKLMGTYSVMDVMAMVKEASDEGASPEHRAAARADLAQALNLPASASDRDILGASMVFAAAKKDEEIKKNATLIEQGMSLMDPNTKKVPFDITYTIAKIDGKDGQFQVEVQTEKPRFIDAIQTIEVLLSAAEYTQKAASSAATGTAAAQVASPAAPDASAQAAATPTPANVQTAAPVAEKSPADSAPASQPLPQVSSETAPQVSGQQEAANAVIEASFDCAKASTKIEKLICSTPETAAADKRLGAAFAAARQKAADPQQLKAQQMDWIKQQRNVCSDAACVLKVTDDRVQQLSRS